MAEAENEARLETRDDELSKKDLVEKLDELLEHYLHTVDAYQQAQQKLTTHLSSVSDYKG